MDRLKQTISRLEKDVDELKQFHKKTVGISSSTGDVHYCTSSQEFGEYSLDEMNTFNFTVTSCLNASKMYDYIYNLENPTPELSAYLSVQGKTFSSGNWISIKPDDYEKYCMEQNGAPVVLTKEIRACLESRLWMYCLNPKPVSHHTENMDKSIKSSFSEDITISFKNIYQIFPHVSFYITPIMNTGITCITSSIKEITCKHVTFTVVNNTPKQQIPEGLTLHYHVNGIVEQPPVVELLN
jgi:hypothetical protein